MLIQFKAAPKRIELQKRAWSHLKAFEKIFQMRLSSIRLGAVLNRINMVCDVPFHTHVILFLFLVKSAHMKKHFRQHLPKLFL